MRIRFRERILQRRYERSAEAEKAYGREVARKYVERVNIIKQAKSLHDIMVQRPLRCHALKGKRKGQYGLRLHDRWRLIFTIESGVFEIVCIEEVSKHYGD